MNIKMFKGLLQKKLLESKGLNLWPHMLSEHSAPAPFPGRPLLPRAAPSAACLSTAILEPLASVLSQDLEKKILSLELAQQVKWLAAERDPSLIPCTHMVERADSHIRLFDFPGPFYTVNK